MEPTRTKIVATVGPASGTEEMIARLIRAGVDVFRLNFSHGSRDAHGEFIRLIRAAAAEDGRAVAVMQDLQGPRIRTGRLAGHDPVRLMEDAVVVLCAGDFEGTAERVAVNYADLATDVRPGEDILLCDGMIELEVMETDGTEVRCRVVTGGWLGERKGINLPGSGLSISAPTAKDIEDLHFGMDQGVDFVALSFVRRGEDIARLKDAMRAHAGEGNELPVIAKIEKPEAVENLTSILQVADGVMVARGDLGIEMPTEAVPVVQKDIIRMANCYGLPVITATQMLESMVSSPRPTRAEASDVANAILDGTDAVMLSGETSIGKHPVEAVRIMDRIARHTEKLRRAPAEGDIDMTIDRRRHALATAARDISDELSAKGIIPFTISGSTARFVSQRRPRAPIFALTPNERTFRRLALLWGVHPIMLDMFETTDEMIERGQERLREMGIASPGDTVVYIAGASPTTPGGSDMIKVFQFE
jgi:pyruvate kinase